jgi:DNA invertase Pin-like site-specific DNA recombinase
MEATMTIAYSYLRFSTPEQMRGDSFRRQAEAARVYAERHRLTLDTKLTFQDLGVSAYRGRNVNRGSLKDFRRAVEGKAVKRGSYLLIESFDRLTRMEPWDALPVFQEIINAGITIVTLQDERSWNRECIRDNPFRILESLLVMVRPHEESATKSRRIRASLDAKREAVRRSSFERCRAIGIAVRGPTVVLLFRVLGVSAVGFGVLLTDWK